VPPYIINTGAKQDMFSSLFVCLSVSNFVQKLQKRICIKFSGKIGNGPMNEWLNFGGDPVHGLDIRIVFRIRHYWEIRKSVSTDCAARHCNAGHALAGIAIATMTSLRHRPTTDCGTDIATLVRPALAEVCTIPVIRLETVTSEKKMRFW